MKKIYFVLPSLRAGGAERVISFLAANLDKSEFEVSLIIVGKKADAAYDIKDIPVVFLNKDRVLQGALPLIKIMAKAKPDIVMSSIGHLNALLGCFSILFPKTKFVGREASVISVFNSFSTRKSLFSKEPLYRFAYKQMDMIVCQSKDMYDDFKETYRLSDNQMVVIANPAPENMQLSARDMTSSKVKKLITIGRLSPEKGHLRLLESLSKVDFPFEYTIIGSGVEEKKIKDEAERLGLSQFIRYIPFTKMINEELIAHDVFLQGSYVEGFPNAVMESCVSGTPVIAYNVPGGTKEILEQGVNGFMVENDIEFLEKLNTMVRMDWDSALIRESVYKKYRAPIIVGNYEAMFKKMYTK
ncbi:glycosyltransferase [Flagellimonas pelagia]|uniref:Glycosyltransferase n=1 Tax=Flagellimonas pelagia TaxID=2306998 RepID=A0A3A1NJI5_9FLAO|nr:glycosyltransferase [Allomuricauda maritima]RIV46046.1 glycosyltransferase [Allomuricauda maritima]TXJ98815.1 glycosyltransferase [Allomuricauda maritima]